jgi:adenosylhomocysteine nucleosidase
MEDVVVFAALAWEAGAALDALQGVEALGARSWRGYLGDGATARVIQIGVGLDRAARRAADVGPAGLYLSCGCAGALAPDLRAGDLVVADRVLGLDATGRVVSDDSLEPAALAAWSLARSLRVRVGAIASSSVVLHSADAKREAARHGALVVEMESGAVVRAARDRGVACTVVKIVLDEAADAIGLPGGDVVDPETGELDVARGVAALALRPRWWPRAVRLARQQRIAERGLRKYLGLLFSAGLDALGRGPQPRGALVG